MTDLPDEPDPTERPDLGVPSGADLLLEFAEEHRMSAVVDTVNHTVVIDFAGTCAVPNLGDLPTFDTAGAVVDLADQVDAVLPDAYGTCTSCLTPLRQRGGAGWTHSLGFNQRDGCQTPRPA